ncbi:MAG: enoyl-CoA hydratase [Rhodospirillaceae bacterium]|nr:enoyl-CoA hydratase [Rhodospirillaceae bacterium]OUT80333.1 MAG: hypothetical protein CBB83_02065 [Rhodospirillaceae bacterium TMED23]|tara:strand:- start:4005 stop:4793 length:789 start_codon:yes stop_codon:yes gene_type:complete
MFNEVLLRIIDKRVAEITLNRPEVLNVYNGDLLISLNRILDRIERNKKIRVVLLKGAGKHFSAGADVNWFKTLSGATDQAKLDAAELSTNTMKRLYEFPIPTIAMIHNACLGGAVGYPASCDIVVASDDARFAITEVKLGITPAPILPQVISAIGSRMTRRYALTGSSIDAFEAKRIGLVHEICNVGDLEQASNPIIEDILRAAPEAVKVTKKLIKDIVPSNYDNKLTSILAEMSATSRSTKEGVEGFSAFLNKRYPNWDKT